jgi:hypothetical protein
MTTMGGWVEPATERTLTRSQQFSLSEWRRVWAGNA